jgi:hypothetical protein
MRIIIIPTGRVRMRIIIKIVQMYQKVRILAQKRYIPHSRQSKIFSLNTVSSRVPYRFRASPITVF